MTGQYQCRVCGVDSEKRGRKWRREKNWRPWPDQRLPHLPRRVWKAPNGQMLCKECRTREDHEDAEPLERENALQKAKLRERSLQLGSATKKLKRRELSTDELEPDASRSRTRAGGEPDDAPACPPAPEESCEEEECEELTVRPAHPHCLQCV